MKSYLGLIPASSKIYKKRNRMTLICISIAVFMITAIFSMADMDVRMEKDRAIEQHGNWHFILKSVSEEKMNRIAEEIKPEAYSRYDVANYNWDENFFIDDKKAVVSAIDKDFATKMVRQFEKGCFLSKDNEIILSSNSKKVKGYCVGDEVVLNTPYGSNTFKISGFIDENEMMDLYDGIGAFISINAFRNLCIKNPEDTSTTVGYYTLSSSLNIRNTISEIKSKYKLNDEQLNENAALLGITGFSSSSYVLGIYVIAGILFILVMLAGIFMITGSINSNVSERTKFFGMLRCIGASKKQILRIVRLEALNWCKIAIPIGILSGIIVSWILCLILHFVVKGEFADIPLWKISYIGIICGIVIGLLSVWIAALSPAKKAASVSPVTAISGNIAMLNKENKAVRNNKKIEISLGVFHAINSQKTLTLLSSSFALCIVIFLIFVSFLQFIDLALPSLRDYAPDMSVYYEGYSQTIDKSKVNEIEKMPEVERAFGRMYKQVEIEDNKKIQKIDLISYDAHQFEWAEKDVTDGNIKPAEGDNGYVITVFDKNNPLKVGDTLKIGSKSVEISAILSDSPFSTDETPIIICSENEFESLIGQTGYSVIDIQMTKEGINADNTIIRSIMDDEISLSDIRQSNTETKATYWAFNICVYAFLFVLSLISVFNIINSISMSTSAKIKEYGMMRAVGMDEKQLSKMIASEGFTYAIFGLIFGLTIGIPLHRFAYLKIITAHFGIQWNLPILSVIIIVAIILIATVIAVYIPSEKIKNKSVTDIIGEINL